MKCLCLLSAKFRCSRLSNCISASPLRRPWRPKQRPTPPLFKARHQVVGGGGEGARLLSRRAAHGRALLLFAMIKWKAMIKVNVG